MKIYSGMDTINANKMQDAQSLIDNLTGKKVKYIKKDAGLIERASLKDEKIILTEDNRQILLG